ncbi:MAG: CubicO group peptidase beta-lactamase class family [Hymenobacter sp.]|jgi:CubicO group peptidase (beta-lactamase class C family)|nr:CubicO group peptidase beta-lactamase class family [Hymenobacter sp.]
MKSSLVQLGPELPRALRNYCCRWALLVLLAPAAAAQPARRTPARPLDDYLGTYEYKRPYGTLQLLPKDSLLLAVIDEGEYPLRRVKRDVFLNSGRDTIPFRRDAAGAVAGFVEHGTFYKRLSGTTAKAPASVYARRLPDGRRPRYAYPPPAAVADGLATASLASLGLNPAPLREMVQALIDEQQYPNVHSVLIWQHGKLVLEEYFYGYDRQRLQQLRSASKSFVSALVGAAIQRQALKSEQDRLLPYFKYPGYANADPRKQDWTVQDFLTMRTGLDCNDNDGGTSAGNEEKMYPQPDWVKFVLDLPLTSSPGRQGSYCSGAVAVLGKAVENATGQSLPQFAEAALFQPLASKATSGTTASTTPTPPWPSSTSPRATSSSSGCCTCRRGSGRAGRCCPPPGSKSPGASTASWAASSTATSGGTRCFR